jgi:putative NIF3 family GTP cyclohydrolase 1 type 2
VRLEELVAGLDRYFRMPDVRNDDWSKAFEQVYSEPYWREYVVRGWEGRWNGLMVRGAEDVEQVVTCVFPSDRIVGALEPGTFVFTEHPLDFADEPGFLPLSRKTFETMREHGISLYNAHAPLDMHPEVSPSRLCAEGVGLDELEEYFPICDGIPGGAAIIGESRLTVDGLANALRSCLGPEIKVHVLTRTHEEAGRVAMVAGGGAVVDLLEASLERGCQTYVTGNAATNCRLDFVQEQVAAFRRRADEAGVTLIDAMHYGMEKPPQLAMVDWFRAHGVAAEFVPDGPK